MNKKDRIWKFIGKHKGLASIGVYTALNFFTKGISFLLLIIYTNPKFITPAENGLLNLFSNCILFVTPLFYMGTLQSSSTEYFKLSAIEFRNFFTSDPGVHVVLHAHAHFLFGKL